MKTKIFFLLAGAAVVTLSFTFVSQRSVAPKAAVAETETVAPRPAMDGILAEDKF